MRTIILAVLTITFGLAITAGPARADDDLTEAKAAFAAGKAAYERGDYPNALSQFQRANLLAPAPSLSYNIGRTYENMGRYHDAVLAFQRYLELVGQPQNADDKKFQESLKERIASLRGKPDAPTPPPATTSAPPPTTTGAPPPTTAAPAAPPPGYPPTYYPYGNPYGYGYAPPQETRELRLKKAQGQRKRAIALIVVGSVLTVVGIAITADGFTNGHDTCLLSSAGDSGNCGGNYVEDFFGVSAALVGVTLWAPGAASYVKSARVIRELTPPEPASAPAAVGPQTFLFHSPVFRF